MPIFAGLGALILGLLFAGGLAVFTAGSIATNVLANLPSGSDSSSQSGSGGGLGKVVAVLFGTLLLLAFIGKSTHHSNFYSGSYAPSTYRNVGVGGEMTKPAPSFRLAAGSAPDGQASRGATSSGPSDRYDTPNYASGYQSSTYDSTYSYPDTTSGYASLPYGSRYSDQGYAPSRPETYSNLGHQPTRRLYAGTESLDYRGYRYYRRASVDLENNQIKCVYEYDARYEAVFERADDQADCEALKRRAGIATSGTRY